MMDCLIRCAVIADVQYADIPDCGSRHYRSSVAKLQRIMQDMQSYDVSCILQLGDLIDRDFRSFDAVMSVLQTAAVPVYHVLGNHDFSVAAEELGNVASRIGLRDRYYDVAFNDLRLIVLDGTDVSLFANPEGGGRHQAARVLITDLQRRGAKNAHPWNGAIGTAQMDWLHATLHRSRRAGETVIIACHFPVITVDNRHTLLNSDQLLELLAGFDHVALVLSGHDHRGHYWQQNNTHFLTVKGLVEADRQPWSIVSCGPDGIEVTGFGGEPSRILDVKLPFKNG